MKVDRTKAKRIAGIVWSVVTYLFLALCIAAGAIAFMSKRSSDGAVSLFGHQLRIVLSGSMEKNNMTDVSAFKIKSIPVKSLIVTQNAPDFGDEDRDSWLAKLEVGDVLTFRYLIAGRQETITHRIISIEEELPEGYKITLRGDNRTENEGEQVIYTAEEGSSDYILGKVVFTSSFLGNIFYILRQPVGIALVVIVPAAIIMIMQIIRIINVFSAERRKKAEAHAAEQSDEIKLLKRRLAEMEMRQNVSEASMPEDGSELPAKTAEESASEGGMPEEGPSETAQESTSAKGGEEALPEEGEETQTFAPETQNEGAMPEDEAQNRDPTGLVPAIKSSKEVEQ